MTIVTVLREMAKFATAIGANLTLGSAERIAADGAAAVATFAADRLEGGDTVDDVLRRMKAPPSLRETIRDDREREDAEFAAARTPRSDEPTGR